MTHKFSLTTKLFIQDASLWVAPTAHDTFGPVSGGELRLRGWLFEIQDIAARRANLKMGGQCRLDYRSLTNLEEKTYYMPLAFTKDKQYVALYQGLFVQKAMGLSDANERKFQRVGLGMIREVREIENGSTHCNILDDASWERLLRITLSKSEEDTQTIILI
jgi:hypothetical protein